MTIRTTSLPGVLVLAPRIHRDPRGFFMETFRADRYAEAGIPGPFVQDNLSRSAHGTLRGLHLQHPNDQGKLVYVVEGEVFDVAVDVRPDSPTFGRHHAELLSAENGLQMVIPPGFAHGFLVTSDTALFAYKCTAVYSPTDEITVAWNDPEIGIDWPIPMPVLSDRDAKAASLKGLDRSRLPRI